IREVFAGDGGDPPAARLVRAGAVSPDRITLSTGRGQRRTVLTLGYDGGRQLPAARQPAIAAPSR
ncbi:hypothetical protein, partial [Sphingomonas sp. dw_22]|uniref:hypothetical protein n=1 Tax=Sphingomonas sp. dw_22 TaxID=2721175 RepID=UPI001BD3B0AA